MPYRIIQLVLFTGGLLLTFGASTVIAQPDFLLQARTVEAGVAVNWTPTEPSTWANLLPTGYQVSRVEIDANGNPLGAVQTLRDRTIPRDSAWFVENRQLEDGLIEPIGFLLYDSTFMFPENELMDETAMKFNFIVYETTLSAPIAEAVGLGITDTEVEPGRSYRYTVQALDGSLRGSIDITVQPRTFVQSPADFVMEFEFPEQTSLSDMLAAVRPGEIEMVRGLAKAYGDSIVLRWGPSSPRLWDLAKRDGYKIHRAQGDAEPEVIAEVFPWTEDQVTPAISGDSMALLAASILFQDRARIAEQNLSFAEEARLFTNAQGFALYAADRSPLAAEILGLRYVDHDVVPGEAYLYFVSTAALEDPILWARFLIVNEYESLPAPFDFRVAAQDKALKLVWNKDINRTRYSAYRLERSSDGENFFPVTEDPMIFAEDPRIPLSEYSYIDSLGVNGQTFYYRLYGSNSFGEWSEAATGYGVPRDLTPPPPALIADGTYNDSLRQFALRWLPADPPVADLAAYQVMMSNKADGFYSAISPLLSPSDYTYSFNISEEMDTDRAFYFKVQSFDQSGNASPSLEHQIIVPDWTPPLPPPAITGTIDSAGRVTVSWEPSPAADLRGYWLYWGNYEDEELTAISQDIILGTEYFWYLEEASLNESIFVCVRAEDDNFNLSETSPLAEIKRPDRVPPIPPMMEVAVPLNGGIEVRWMPSSSQDTRWQFLEKRPKIDDDNLWELVDSIPPQYNRYFDAEVKIGQPYDYRIRAADDAENYCTYSAVVFTQVPFPHEAVKVSDLEAMARQDGTGLLQWTYTPLNEQLANEPYQFDIYRSTGRGAVQYYQSVPADQFSFTDQALQPTVLYNYAVRVRFTNGWLGDLSPTKSVLVQ